MQLKPQPFLESLSPLPRVLEGCKAAYILISKTKLKQDLRCSYCCCCCSNV